MQHTDSSQKQDVTVLAEVNRGSGQSIRLMRSTFNGHEYYNLRLFWENDTGEVVPTKKGVTFRMDEPEKVKTILDAWQSDVNRNERRES
ncbi:MAG TPA: hypothetical protein ENH10_02500 [Bacteroidetes bacterium]|nr:hypothetical protein [Bacteroidota bacterium]HEX04010.1 hypothetical protein [Bacteroidota bacterium]